MTVYIEIVFFENFAIDYFLLLAGEKITFIPAKHPIIASILGAIYALIMPLYSSGSFGESFIILFFMCILCYKPNTKKDLLFSFVAVSCAASALYGIVNLFFYRNRFFYNDDFLFIIALCSCLCSVGIYRLLTKFMSFRKIRENIALLEVCNKKFPAFIDSGNSLYYKNIPVILVNKSLIEDYDSSVKPLIIPFSGVNSYGALLGFKPKKAYLTYMNKTVELKCVVALCDRKFNNFDALLHPDLIKECI